MSKILQHRPGFFDSDNPQQEIEFSTLEELLKIKFVKKFTNRADFYQFSISRKLTSPTLMAEYDNGYKWWVIGFLINTKEEIKNQLPAWKPKYKDK